MVKILCSLILDFQCWKPLLFLMFEEWYFCLLQDSCLLDFLSIPDAVGPFCLTGIGCCCVESLCVIYCYWGEKGHLLVELKLKTYQRHAYLICQCQCWAVKLPKMIMMFLEGQPCWTTAILFTPFWMNKWLNVGEMTTYAHIILQSGSEWEHRSLQTSFPAAQLDKTVFFFLFFHTWYKKSASLLKC